MTEPPRGSSIGPVSPQQQARPIPKSKKESKVPLVKKSEATPMLPQKTLSEKRIILKDPRTNKILRDLSLMARGGRIGDAWSQVLTHVYDDKKPQLIGLLENISNCVQKAKYFSRLVVLTVVNPKVHPDLKFRVVYENKKHQTKAILLFDESLAEQVVSGQFKKTARAYEISSKGSKEKMFTVEKIKAGQNAPQASEKTIRRERATLEACRKHNIPGTPKTYLISFYKGTKKTMITQQIIQKFYPGGNLGNVIEAGNLDMTQKYSIARQLCATLAKFHEAGLSHNDYRPENIVLDNNQNPILIDFGGTTSKDDPNFAIGSLKYFPPEMAARDPIEKYDRLEELGEAQAAEHATLSTRIDELRALKKQETKPVEKVKLGKQIVDLVIKLGQVEDDLDKTGDLLDAVWGDAKSSVKIEKWVPCKNDAFALGLTLKKLFGSSLPPEAKAIIDGLTKTNPDERLTAAEAQKAFEAIP